MPRNQLLKCSVQQYPAMVKENDIDPGQDNKGSVTGLCAF